MAELRTFEITYTKNAERKTFVEQVANFYQDDEWRLVATRFNIPNRDLAQGQEPETWKTKCISSGYTDVTFVETP
ncbi:hypothetical protein D3C81_1584140 [compost metagenome]